MIKNCKEQIKQILKYSQDFKNDEPKVDALYQDWLEGKKDFIELMNNNLIYEYPETIYFEMDEKDKIKNVEDFITTTECEYKYLTYIKDIIEFFEVNKTNFYSNKTSEDFIFTNWFTNEKIKIKKGIKIGKALKFFISDKEILTDLQMAVSRVIQKDKVKGKLCLSVHPLDFLSSSENTHNWRSCHALDGEYRMGNLSYMTDSSTVICYLKSEKDAILPNFPPTIPWNNKKWRVLIHFSNDKKMIFSGRQYPFSSQKGLDLVLEKLLPGIGFKDEWTKWDNTTISTFKGNVQTLSLNGPFLPVNEKLINLYDLVKPGKNALNYNDVLHSSYYKPYYSYYLDNLFFRCYTGGTTDQTHFTIGGPVKCLHCEEELITIEDIPRCIHCEEKYGTSYHELFDYCIGCGERIYIDNANYVEGEGYICDSCLKTKEDYVVCSECGMILHESQALFKEDGSCYCKWCF